MKHEHLPAHLRVQWHIIRRVSKYNYPRAMQLAGEWGKWLAEYHIQTESA